MAVNLKPSQIFWYYPVIVIFCVLIGVVVSTQLTAYLLDEVKLGEPFFTVFGYSFYYPWMYFFWLKNSVGNGFSLFVSVLKGGAPILVSLFLSRLAVIQFSVRKFKTLKDSDTHGSARWASKDEIKKMPLGADKGVVLGYHDKFGFLVNDSDEPIGVEAPTRSGKGTVIGIPTLLFYPHSVVALDIKGELWELTSGHRSRFTHAIKIDTFEPDAGVFWNPLLEIRQESEVADAQIIADIMIQSSKDEGKQDFEYFKSSAKSVLVAAIIHILYTSKDKTISAILRFLRNPAVDQKATIKVMLYTRHLGDKPHPLIEEKARELLNMASSPNQLNGVIGTVITALSLYEDPRMAKVCSKSHFYLTDILNSEYPVSLYLKVPPSDVDRVAPFLGLFFNLFAQKATQFGTGAKLKADYKYRKLPSWLNYITPKLEQYLNKDMYEMRTPHKHKCLMFMDEFATLKYMPFFSEGLSYIAGYGIKVLLIYQTPNQLAKYYGHKNTLKDNLSLRVYFTPADLEIAKSISGQLGQFTKKVNNVSIIGKRFGMFLENVSMNTQEVGRPLMTPDELLTMPSDKYIVMVKNNHPIMATRVDYFTHPVFNRKILPPSSMVDEETGKLDLPSHDTYSSWNQFEYSLDDYQRILAEINADEEVEEDERMEGLKRRAIREKQAKEGSAKPKTNSGTSSSAKPKKQDKEIDNVKVESQSQMAEGRGEIAPAEPYVDYLDKTAELDQSIDILPDDNNRGIF